MAQLEDEIADHDRGDDPCYLDPEDPLLERGRLGELGGRHDRILS